jgi:signal transduction histidine kinase
VAELPALITEIYTVLALESLKVEQEDIELSGSPSKSYLPLSRQALAMILQELLENAHKFHPEHAPTVKIKLSLEPGYLTLQVSDDGLTLSPEQLSKIWVPYYQGEKYFTGQITGMGLGLAMVAALVWEAGGSCRAFNREAGPGVVIELRLPLTEQSAKAEDQPKRRAKVKK